MVKLSVSADGGLTNHGISEPSTIYMKLPISNAAVRPDSVEKLTYFPKYAGMTPQQRSIYLSWLQDVTRPIDTGFVFVYYYGLERHLVYGKFREAVNEVLLLRQHHKNGSFQSYSAAALVHACLLRRDLDMLRHLYLDLDFDYFGNSVLLILHQQSLDLLPDMLIRLALCLSGVNKRYIKEKCPMYQAALLNELRDQFGKEAYPFASRYSLNEIKGVPYPIFANYSFESDVRAPPLPNLINHKPFQSEFEQFFQRVHEKAKLLRKSQRKMAKQVKALPTEKG